MRWSRSPSSSARNARANAVDVEPGRQLAARDALAEQHLRGPDEPLAAAGEHLADAGLLAGLGPGADETHLARLAVELVDRLDVVGDRDGEPLRRST